MVSDPTWQGVTRSWRSCNGDSNCRNPWISRRATRALLARPNSVKERRIRTCTQDRTDRPLTMPQGKANFQSIFRIEASPCSVSISSRSSKCSSKSTRSFNGLKLKATWRKVAFLELGKMGEWTQTSPAKANPQKYHGNGCKRQQTSWARDKSGSQTLAN